MGTIRASALALLTLALVPSPNAPFAAESPPLTQEALPSLGETASNALSIEQERRLGQRALREIRQQMPVLSDPIANAYLNSLGDRLTSNAPNVRFRFRFLIVDSPEINAFAAPGGIIVIYTGLIKAASNEAELAAVMAHEIAHITQRHFARTVAEHARLSGPTLLAALGAVLVGLHDPTLGQAALASTMAGAVQQQLNFSRSHELEADEVGIRMLTRSHLDPNAMVDFFATLARDSHQSESGIPALLLTHPATSDRISEARNRSSQISGAGRLLRDSQRFRLFKARIIALTTPPDELLEGPHTGKESPAQQYALALALLRAGHANKAALHLAELHRVHPKSIMLSISLAEAWTAARHNAAAVTLLRTLNELHPGQPLIVATLAQSLLAAGQANQAQTLLENQAIQSGLSADMLHLLAKSAAAAGDDAGSHEALARYYAKQGELNSALKQIEIALRAPNTNASTRSRLHGLKTIYEQELKISNME